MARTFKLQRGGTSRFVAPVAVCFEEDGVRVAVAAADPFGDGPRLEISRAVTSTAAEAEAGLGTYQITAEDGRNFVGGVDEFGFQGGEATFRFLPVAARTLGLPERLRVRLAVPADEAVAWARGVVEILGGTA